MRPVIPDREAKGFLLTDHHEQSLGAGDSGVNQIALEQHVMLHGDWDYHCREL